MTTHTILCGSCKSPAKAVANSEPDDKVTCPDCGREDRFEDVMGSVRDYIGHSAAKAISSRLRQTVGNSKFIKVTSKPVGERSFRWVTTELGL